MNELELATPTSGFDLNSFAQTDEASGALNSEVSNSLPLNGGILPLDSESSIASFEQAADATQVIRYEAEDLNLTGYRLETVTGSQASGGQHISLKHTGRQSGSAVGTFEGEAGTYRVSVGYYDENDGISTATLTVGGERESFAFDRDLPSNWAKPAALTERVTHDQIALDPGDTFEIEATLGGTEFARFDYIEFSFIDAPIASVEQAAAANQAIRYEAEDLNLTGYRPEIVAGSQASGGQHISLKHTGHQSGSAVGTFDGEAGTYRVSVGYYDENDGISTATLTVGGERESFAFDRDLPSNWAKPAALTERVTHEQIALDPGDTFEIEATLGSGEFARFDYIEFSPVDVPAPVDPLASPTDPESDGPVVTIQDLIESVTLPHEVSPLPSVPSHWKFARYPTPSTQAESHRLDRPLGRGYTKFNPWNHLDSVKGVKPDNTMVEMGDLHLAFYIDGEWREHNFGPPCVAAEHAFGNISQRFGDRGQCQNGSAYAGIGFNGWTNPKHHTHGWSPAPHVQYDSEDIEHVLAWGSARTVPIDPSQPADLDGGHYQYRIGADKRNPEQKGTLPAITHGRALIVEPEWQSYIATTMRPDTLKQMCQLGELPDSLPFQGGC